MEHNKLMIQLGNMSTTTKIDELLYAKELENRELFLPEEVDDSIISEIVSHILRYNKEDENLSVEERKPIKIFINCYGGDVIACFSAIDTIKLSKTPIYTYNLGKAMSSGGLILMAGHKRFSYKNAVVLVHQGYAGAQGTTGQVFDTVEFQKRIESRVKDYIIENTNISKQVYTRKLKEEWYLFGDEALAQGIVDELITELP
jgi:ATP-dependent Clp protease protease subunit